MPALKIGIQLADLNLSLRSALTTAARLGASAVELDAREQFKPSTLSQSAVRELRKLLADLNLKVSAVSYATQRGYNVLDRLDARIAGTKGAMQFAYNVGAAVVVNHVGMIPSEPEGPEWTLLIDALSELGKYGQHVGATLAAQTGTDAPALLARLIKTLPTGSLGVDFCPAQMILDGHEPLESLEWFGQDILHVHVGDGVRDRARGRGAPVQLGRGVTDWPALLAALEQYGYRGYFTLESPGGDAVVALGNAIQYLRNL